MIIALQMLILLRESVLAVLNGWLPPFFKQLVSKLSDNGLVPAEDEIEEQVYADYDEECGVVFFPPVHAQRYAAVCDCLMDERWFGKLEKVLNIGKHYDVNFMNYLTKVSGITHILGLDIASSLNCTCDMLDISFSEYPELDKPLQITLLQGNAADPDYRLIGCDAVIGVELIQKLLPHDLDRIVHNVFGFIKPRVAIFTTPNADFNCLMNDLTKDGLRQSDHYFEWTREQLHDWCSNIVARYPDYMVTSRGVCPGPTGTSHYGCFCQLILFISNHYKKEMELNVNSLVAVSEVPVPDQDEIGWITPMASTHSVLQGLLETDSSELRFPESAISESTQSLISEHILTAVQNIDKYIQCNLQVEFNKSFVMFNEDEMYEVRMARKTADRNVYEIGNVANRLNNTMYNVKNFSKTTQYLIEKNEIKSQGIIDEILKLTEKLTSELSRCSGENSRMWNNVNWGENVPYWNQYYKVVGVYHFPYEGKSEDDTLLELLLGVINKVLDAHPPGSQLSIPVETLMDAVKHITDDVERVITLMEDSGYELEGNSVVYTGVDASDASPDDKCETKSDLDSISSTSSCGQDVNGCLLNRKLGRKVRMLRLMLQHDDEVKQALGQVVCRLKKIAMSAGRDKKGAARTKWLQSKLLDILTLTEKAILRRQLRDIENDPLKGLGYDGKDETAVHLTKINTMDDTAEKIVEKYEALLRMSAGDFDDSDRDTVKSFHTDSSTNSMSVDVTKLNNEKEVFEKLAAETDNLSFSPNDELTRYTLDELHIDSDVQDWEEKDMSLYHEDTIEPKEIKCEDIKQAIQSYIKESTIEYKVKTSTKPTKKKKRHSSNKSNSSISKKKSKNGVNLITVKRSLKFSASYKVLDRKIDSPPKQEQAIKELAYNNTLTDCIESIRKKMGPTLVLTIPPKPIPDSILQLCHPDLHQKTTDSVQKASESFDDGIDSPVAATDHGQRIEILSHSKTLTIALQRMIGTDPDVDNEIFEHELELSDRSLLDDTSSCIIPSSPSSPGQWETIKATPSRELNYPQPDGKSFVPSIADTVKTPVVEILTPEGRELIALQRTMGTDPDYMCERELVNSKLTSSEKDTESFEKVVPLDGGVSSQENFLYATPSRDLNYPQPDGKSSVPSIAVTAKTPIVEILTPEGREVIALQRTIGTDPVYIEVCERELTNSKVTNSVKNTQSFEKVFPSDERVSSQEFFLYDINEPTTSKGLRHVGMGVQCGTDGQVSATTSVSFPFRKFVPGIKIENSFSDIREGLKTDCVTSTNDILKPCGRMSPPWMRSVGIRIKDSFHRIEEPTSKDTTTARLTVNDELVPKKSMTIETLRPNQQIRVIDSLEKHTKKHISNLRPIANTKRFIESCRPKSGSALRIKESNHRKPESTAVTRFLNVPKGVRSKLSCGAVHVHSYKDLQVVSEDVLYQGQWQRPRQKPLRKNVVYGNFKKPNRPSAEKLKNNRKVNASNKCQNPAIAEQPKTVITTPIKIRNTKASKMKEAVTKNNLQKKLAVTKLQVTKNRLATLPKVTSKTTLSHSIAIKDKSNKLIQPRRQTRFAQQPTIINENKIPSARTRNEYIPPYLYKMFKQQDPNAPSKLEVKTDSLSNLLNVNDEQITSKTSHSNEEKQDPNAPSKLDVKIGSLSNLLNINAQQIKSKTSNSKVDNLVSALLKISIEPSKNEKCFVYLNEKDISQCSTTAESIHARPSKQCNLMRQSSNQFSSVYSAKNSSTIIINPVVTIPKRFQPKRQPMPIKSSVSSKASDSKVVSRIKKIARLFSKKSPIDVYKEERVPGMSILPQPSSKLDSLVDLTLDETDNLTSSEALYNTSPAQSVVKSSDSKIGAISNDESKECAIRNNTQDSETLSLTDQHETPESATTTISHHTHVLSRGPPKKSISNNSKESNDTFDAMKRLIEECLYPIDTPALIVNKASETIDIKRPDTGNIHSVESGTYVTSSSLQRTNEDPSLASVTQSFSDFSYRLQPSTSKLSGCLADSETWSITVPSYNNSYILPEAVSLRQNPNADNAFSSFSVNADPSPLPPRQVPDYVNLVDSETGSCANAPRRATSEEVLLSGRSSSSYVSCTLDEDAVIPSWLFNINQRASESFASSSNQQPIAEEVPDLEYDINGNEMTVHGAGAGDGYGIHSDQSQDSSGQGTSFSSSSSTSGVQSESSVVEPAAFMPELEQGERPDTSNAAPLVREDSSDSPVNAAENTNPPRPLNRSRIPRIAHRVNLPASDADVSSSTDVASDN